MKELLEQLKKFSKDSKNQYVDTLVLVKLILEQYDSSKYVKEDEMREKIKSILNKFYE